MNIHEYQAKEIMKKFGINVPTGRVAKSPAEAVSIAEQLGGDSWMVKAQIHAGGRGKAGGIKKATSLDEVQSHAGKILDSPLMTHQTGLTVKNVSKVLVEQGCKIEHEFYLGLTLDRRSSKVTFMASTEGGVDIETVAKNNPEKIVTATIEPAVGFTAFIGRKLGYGIGLRGDQLKQFSAVCKGLYDLFISCDCTLAEINPLASTTTGFILALDAKLTFDDNALFRHADIAALRDFDEESPQETAAARYGLTYIGLEGNIGCLVNGAGLAMATMDIIKLHGGEPANFLDAGGSATREAIEQAFSIILEEEHVTAVLINIFGGILRCDIIADGVVAAAQNLSIQVPLVVRLEGTNVELGKQILKDSDLSIITANNLADAAKKVVAAADNYKGRDI